MFICSLDNHRIFSFCLFPLSSSLLLPHLAGWTRVYDNLHTLSDTLSRRTNPLLNFKPAFSQSQFIIYYEMSLSISGLLLRKMVLYICSMIFNVPAFPPFSNFYNPSPNILKSFRSNGLIFSFDQSWYI